MPDDRLTAVTGDARRSGAPTPEFEMPPEPDGAAASSAPDPPAPGLATLEPADPAGHAAASQGSDGLPASRGRRRVGWPHVIAAGVVGALLGAAVPATLQALDRAAAADDVERLRAVTVEYLTAVAERRADDATTLVPLMRDAEAAAIAPAEILAAAQPIERPRVRLVHIDGDLGTVEVRFRVGGREHERALAAERVDGQWTLLTSLAERATVQPFDNGLPASIAGISLTARQVRLYPGTYELDLVEDSIFAVGGERIAVDGDPRTPTEIHVERRLSEPLAEIATDLAIAAAAECQAAGSCSIAERALLGTPEGAHLRSIDPDGRIQLGVPIVATSGTTSSWLELPLRLTVDDEGRPLLWECGLPGTGEIGPGPCPTLG